MGVAKEVVFSDDEHDATGYTPPELKEIVYPNGRVVSRTRLFKSLFKAIDTDKSGFIDLAEYKAVVKSETVKDFFAFLDGQEIADGKITLSEWITGWQKLTEEKSS